MTSIQSSTRPHWYSTRSVRVLLAAGILVALLSFAGVEDLARALMQIDLWSVAALFAIAGAMIWVSCLKWRLFLRSSGSDASLLRLMKYYLIGYFFNLFTPSFIGGDVARSYQLGHHLGRQKDAFVSTYLERFTGLLAMVGLGVLFVSLGVEVTAGLEWAIALLGVATAGLALVTFSRQASSVARQLSVSSVRRIGQPKFSERLERLWRRMDDAFTVTRQRKSLLVASLGLSLVFHVLTVVNTYVAARAIGWENPPFAGLFVVVPLVLIVGMVPVTPSGIGIQEGAFLFFLQRIGATSAQGLMVGLLLRAKVVILGLIGGIIFAMEPSRQGSGSHEPVGESHV